LGRAARLLRRLRCRILGGHLRVTSRGAGVLRERCYLCGEGLGRGWDFADLVRRGRPDQGRVVRWWRRAA
jgi:hypothetical protein